MKKKSSKRKKPTVFVKLPSLKTTEVFDDYWRFAAERQAIFFKRLGNSPYPWTKDGILQEYKFTNTYRASDRVSQYLIKRIIYEGEQSPKEIFFRIIFFKTFNKIETWELLYKKLGGITYKDYSFERYDKAFRSIIKSGKNIYSGAYIMASGGKAFSYPRKYQNHLKLLELMIKKEVPAKIVELKSLQKLFELLKSFPTIGNFLAYQYAIDINYSELTNFDEQDFVVPGPGARDGIHKCFSNIGEIDEAEVIKMMADKQEKEFERLNIKFKTLWGRPLKLIDCQNLFCEVDKYARLKYPNIKGLSGRTRIKQRFKMNSDLIEYWYPPKWGINECFKDGVK